MINEIATVFFIVIIFVLGYGTIKSLLVKNNNLKKSAKHSPPMWTNTRWIGMYVPPPPISQPPNRRPEIKKDFKFFKGYD